MEMGPVFSIVEDTQVVESKTPMPEQMCMETVKEEDYTSITDQEIYIGEFASTADLQFIDIIALMFAKLSLFLSLSSWVYYRYDGITIRFQTQSTFLNYGAVMIGWYPSATIDQTNPLSPFYNVGPGSVPLAAIMIQTLSQCHPLLLSYATTDSGVMEIPWNSPSNKALIKFNSVYSRSQFTLAYMNLCGPNAVSGTGSVNSYIKVYAKFNNFRLIGRSIFTPVFPVPVPEEINNEKEKKVIKKERVYAQSKGSHSNPFVRALPVLSALSMAFDRPHIEGDRKSIATQNSNQLVSVKQDVYGSFASIVPDKGIPALAETRKPGREVLDRMPGYMGDSTINQICRVPTIIHVAYYTASNQYHSYIMDPLLMRLDGEQLSAGSLLESHTYMSYFAKMFRLWRGGIKVQLRFYTSPEIFGRFSIQIYKGAVFDASNVTGSITEYVTVKGDTVVEFEVPYLFPSEWRKVPTNGLTYWQDKYFSTDVPTLGVDYNNSHLQLDGIASNEYTSMSVQMIDGPSQPADITPTIFMVVCVAGAEDFQFASLTDTKDATIYAQSLEMEFKSSFPMLGGRSMPDKYYGQSEPDLTAVDLMRRMSPRSNFSLDARPSRLIPFRTSTRNAYPKAGIYDYVGALFFWWRGDVDVGYDCVYDSGTLLFTMASNNGQPVGLFDVNYLRSQGNGQYRTISDYNPFALLTVPYINSFVCAPTQQIPYTGIKSGQETLVPQPFPLIISTLTGGFSPNTYYIRARDNFQLSMLLPVPFQTFQQW